MSNNLLRGVLIWKLPTAEHLALTLGTEQACTTGARNEQAEKVFGHQLMQINHVVIFIDGRFYYVIKDKITGRRGDQGKLADLPELVRKLQETIDA